MPRKRKGARLYQLKSGEYVIRDTGKPQRSTGTRDLRDAEKALAAYIARQHGPRGRSNPEELTVTDALVLYGREHAIHCRDSVRTAHAIQALNPVLGDLSLSRINGPVCRHYAETRDRAPATIRRELGVLQAAINHCHREGHLSAPVKVTLPAKTPPRDRWLSRSEAARLLWATRRNPRSRHLARYILIALYTGSRTQAILSLQWMANTQGGHIDLDRGVMYRRGAGVQESKKRTPTVPLPRALLAHMRRWQRDGSRYVVHVEGCRIGRIKTAWGTAVRESGIDATRPHDLRHTCATWLMQAGADKWAVCGFLGMSLEILESTYGHHHPDHLKSAVEAIDRRALKLNL